VNGCFWHGHSCKRGKLPKTHHAFWKSKIEKNMMRDRENVLKLIELGWKPIIIWTCETTSIQKLSVLGNRLVDEIQYGHSMCDGVHSDTLKD